MDNNKPESVLTVTPPPVPSDTEPMVAEFSNNSKLTELHVWSSGSTVLHIGNVIADELNDIRRKHDEESKENLGSLGEERVGVTENKLGLAYVENSSMRAITYEGKLVVQNSMIDNKLHVAMVSESDAVYIVSNSITFGDCMNDINFAVTTSSIFKEDETALQEADMFLLSPVSHEEIADLKFSIVGKPKFYMEQK